MVWIVKNYKKMNIPKDWVERVARKETGDCNTIGEIFPSQDVTIETINEWMEVNKNNRTPKHEMVIIDSICSFPYNNLPHEQI